MSKKYIIFFVLLILMSSFITVNADKETCTNCLLQQQKFKLQTSRLLTTTAEATRYLAGQYIYFGSYEQDGNIENGPEPIEWQVLSVDGNRILLISRYVLDKKPYNESGMGCTWETSSLRAWLNKTFFIEAFNLSEQKQIALVTNHNYGSTKYGSYYENDTEDRIFVPSTQELDWYFSSYQGALKCQTTKRYGSGDSYWALRTPGKFREYTMNVTNYGDICDWCHGNDSAIGIRPALWLIQE